MKRVVYDEDADEFPVKEQVQKVQLANRAARKSSVAAPMTRADRERMLFN
jgi:hypothetical protein